MQKTECRQFNISKTSMKTDICLFALTFLITMVYSDFHVLQGIAPGGGIGMEACPSNYYNCKCWKNGENTVLFHYFTLIKFYT